ncbi:MAG: hypothetical protein VX554_04645, partial [Candidatus Thermoplasmatota archaeon]|nr:hypothetical protein [Candidatus Thermoplasmatota archaeon]
MQGLISARVVSLGRHGRTRLISTAIAFSELQPIITEDSFMSEALDLATGGGLVRTQLRLM